MNRETETDTAQLSSQYWTRYIFQEERTQDLSPEAWTVMGLCVFNLPSSLLMTSVVLAARTMPETTIRPKHQLNSVVN